MSGEEARRCIEEAESSGLARGKGTENSFAHALFPEMVYDSLPSQERAELHARIAESLKRLRWDDPWPPLAEIAHHLHAGYPRTDPGEAMRAARRVGDRSMGLCAYEDAAEHYRLALVALDRAGSGNDSLRCDLLLAMGEAERRCGDLAAARESFREAADLARSRGSSERFATAVLGYGGPWVTMGEVDETLVALLDEALVRLGPAKSPLRVRALARLAMELYFAEESLQRRIALIEEAREAAQQLGNTDVLGEVLVAEHFALWGPGNVENRLATADTILELGRENGNEELVLAGRHWRIVDLLELGEIVEADREIEAMGRLAARLRIPVFLWQVTLHRATRALLDGRFEEAEKLARSAFDHGRRSQPESAEGSFWVQMVALRREQGCLGEIVQPVESWIRRNPNFPRLEVFAAYVQAELGNALRARQLLEQVLAPGAERIPRLYSWIGEVAYAAEIVAATEDAAGSKILYDLLSPYARRNVPLGRSSAHVGSAARFLGLLAFVLGRPQEGRRRFEEALAQNRRMGARPFEARTGLELARLLLATGETDRGAELAREARVIARELGMKDLEHRAEELLESSLSAREPGAAGNAFLREAQIWTIRFRGSVIRLRDARGLHLLDRLLRHPGREFHAVELAATTIPQGDAESTRRAAAGLAPSRLEAGDEILDDRARREIRRRLADLESELEEAERFQDQGRTVRLRSELEELHEALSTALGLGGRSRRTGSLGEKARVSVTKAIRRTIRRISSEDRSLGRHLERSIRTGRMLSYDPREEDPRWTF